MYVAAEEKTLFAVDTASGAERRRYTTLDKIKASPVLDDHGNVIVGSEGQDLVILNPAGVVVYQRPVSDKVTQSASTNVSGDVIVRVGDKAVVTLGRLPDHWDGRPDVQPTDSKKVWKLVNPVAIDVGADLLHQTTLPDGSPLTGKGVTVAMVDSGAASAIMPPA